MNRPTLLPPLLVALEQQAAHHPTRPAIVDAREAVTRAALAERVKECTSALDTIGLNPGECVSIHGLNSIELAATLLA